MSALELLVGQELERVERVYDYHQLTFSRCLLNVFNPMRVDHGPTPPSVARLTVSVVERGEEVELRFADGSMIHIDMRPCSWTAPEALALYQGGECIAVWS